MEPSVITDGEIQQAKKAALTHKELQWSRR